MKTSRVAASMAAGILLTLAAWASAAEPATPPATQPVSADWPQWRGPNRNGVAPDSPKLLDSWSKEGPKLLWKSGPLPGGYFTLKNASPTDCGSSSPVVADGRVFVYADWSRNYVVTSKMLADWGWQDGVPDELAEKIEKARTSRKQHLADADLDKYIDDFLAKLDPDQAKKFGDCIRKRIRIGNPHWIAGTPDWWWQMAAIVDAGVQDKVFPTYGEWRKSFWKTGSLRGHPLIIGEGDWSHYFFETVLRNADRADAVFCLDAANGKQLWKMEFPGESLASYDYPYYTMAGGVSATPTISDGKCYVAGSAGTYCLSAKDGSVVWKVKSAFTHSSPLVANGMVYVITRNSNTDDKAGADLKAYDAETGQLIWRQASVNNTSNSVALWTHEGKNYLIAVTDFHNTRLSCLAADTGAVVWKSAEVFGAESTATPAIVGDIVVVRGTAAFRLTPQKAELLWIDKKAQGGSYYGGDPVVYQGFVYGASAYAPGYCKDFMTGEKKWDAKSQVLFGEGPVEADGKMFLIYNKHEIAMIKAAPDKYVELGHFAPVPQTFFTTSPAIVGGRLYLRLVDCLACYDLTEAGNKPSATSLPDER